MNSPTPSLVWQGSAQARAGVFAAFAMKATARHCFCAGQGQPSRDLRSQRCYPSPSLRSGPSQAGPILFGGVAPSLIRCGSSGNKICFEMRDIAVESAAITTNSRGSILCASRLSSSPFFPRPLRAACRTPRRAAWPVLRRAPWSPMRPTATCLLARSLVALPVSRPAASRLACRPATRATEPLADRAAFGRSSPHSGTIRAARPGGPFTLRLMGEADV